MIALETQLRREIVEAGRRLYQKNMVASNDGNISARLSEGEILITPTGVCKGDMTEDMLLKVDMEGNRLEGYLKATSEMKMHLAVYRQRPDVGAVVHAHPQKATAFAVANLNFDEITLPEAILADVCDGVCDRWDPADKADHAGGGDLSRRGADRGIRHAVHGGNSPGGEPKNRCGGCASAGQSRGIDRGQNTNGCLF